MSQFVPEIHVPKVKLKTVKTSYKESFYIYDTPKSAVLNQKHDEQLRHCQIQVFTGHSPT